MIQSELADIRVKKIVVHTLPRIRHHSGCLKNAVIIGLKLYKTGLYRLLPQVTPEKPLKKEKFPGEFFEDRPKIDVVVVSSAPKGRQLNSPLN